MIRSPNQLKIDVVKNKDKKATYTSLSVESINLAMELLDGNAFKAWMYFAKNQNGYSFVLSPAAASDYFSKNTLYRAVEKLKEVGYLCQPDPQVNNWKFYCVPENIEIRPEKSNDLVTEQFQNGTTLEFQNGTPTLDSSKMELLANDNSSKMEPYSSNLEPLEKMDSSKMELNSSKMELNSSKMELNSSKMELNGSKMGREIITNNYKNSKDSKEELSTESSKMELSKKNNSSKMEPSDEVPHIAQSSADAVKESNVVRMGDFVKETPATYTVYDAVGSYEKTYDWIVEHVDGLSCYRENDKLLLTLGLKTWRELM